MNYNRNIGFIGSCQLHMCDKFFLNDQMQKKYNINVVFALAFYEYDCNYPGYIGELDYSIFNNIDILIIEINSLSLDNPASSEKIIDYCINKNIKIIKTFLIKFPIYPLNFSGYGENKNDYLNWVGLDNIDYKEKFKNCIESMHKSNIESDLSIELTDFVEKNFNKQLLFTDSLHPKNKLLYQLWKYILQSLSINIEDNNYIFTSEILTYTWYNPFTIKMINDLDIQITDVIIDDHFYINKYNENKYLWIENDKTLETSSTSSNNGIHEI